MDSFFQILNLFSNFWLKTEKYSNELRGVDIDQSAICYLSMDSFRHALQTYESFSNFGIIF